MIIHNDNPNQGYFFFWGGGGGRVKVRGKENSNNSHKSHTIYHAHSLKATNLDQDFLTYSIYN